MSRSRLSSTQLRADKRIMEERSEVRYRTNSTATLRVLVDTDARGWVMHIVNVSRSGLRAECGRFLRPGTHVSIKAKELTVVGTVQNCTEIRSGLFGFGIGISEVRDRAEARR